MNIEDIHTIRHVTQSHARLGGDPGAQAFADEFKREYLDKGFLGAKAGRGFYTCPDPACLHPGFPGGEPGQSA